MLFRTAIRRYWRRLFPLPKPIQIPIYIPVFQNELLKGRCALITGGTSGIGLAIAKAFIDAGASVIITGRKQAKIENALNILGGKNAYGFVLDNSQNEDFEDSVNQLIKQYGLLDILVNNAGIGGGNLCTTTINEYDQVMNTNLRGAFFLSRIIARRMIQNNIKGNILNIASSSSLRPANSAYILSKWGIRAFTEGLAKTLIKHQIVVNAIAPGPTATPMLCSEDNIDISRSNCLFKRYITTTEIANMSVILVSNLGRSVVGDVVYMTGGSGNLTNDDFDYSFTY